MNVLPEHREFLLQSQHPEYQYLDILGELRRQAKQRPDRTGVGVYGVFGRHMRFDLSEGFPLLTTKRLHFKSIVAELLWFLSGSTNANDLGRVGCSIWDEWAAPDGELGPVYGKQWRSWAAPDGRSIDQIANLLHGLQSDPYGRRHVVSAWNPADIENMALPPCHCLFQFYVADGRLSCQLYQRSADFFLGVPFNIASYSLLTLIIAKTLGLEPGEFIHTLGDTHLYANHLAQADKQLGRTPRSLPMLSFERKESVFEYTIDDFLRDGALRGYDPDEHIKAPVAV